jgi:hypothetical protein
VRAEQNNATLTTWRRLHVCVSVRACAFVTAGGALLAAASSWRAGVSKQGLVRCVMPLMCVCVVQSVNFEIAKLEINGAGMHAVRRLCGTLRAHAESDA